MISCSAPTRFLTTTEATKSSWFNQGFRKGHNEGYKTGELLGYKNGYRKGKQVGYIDGESTGIIKGTDYVINSYKKDSLDVIKHPSMLNRWIENYEENVKNKSRIENNFIQKGFQTAKDSVMILAYKAGYDFAYNKIDSIRLMQSQSVKLIPYNLKPIISYEGIVEDLSKVSLEYPHSDLILFSNLVERIHNSALDYIAIRLNLDSIATKDMYYEYKRIHQDLALLYFEKYLEIYNSVNAKYNTSFYNFKLYYSVEIFVDIINSGICSVADVVLTYAKKNSQFAAISGLHILGNVCQILIDEVLKEFEDNLKKVTLKNEYNSIIPALTISTKNVLSPVIIENRKFTKTVLENIKLSKNYSVDITMEIETFYSVGIDTSSLVISVNHLDQNFIIDIPNKPILLGINHQSYKVTNILNKFNFIKTINKSRYIYSMFHSLPFIIFKNKNHSIDESLYMTINSNTFNEIFNKSITKADEIVIDQDFKSSNNENISGIIKNAFEPALALPSSCYNVYMKFAGKTFDIFKINCE